MDFFSKRPLETWGAMAFGIPPMLALPKPHSAWLQRENGPHTRYWWLEEGHCSAPLFKSPPPRGADWPKMHEGFHALMWQ